MRDEEKTPEADSCIFRLKDVVPLPCVDGVRPANSAIPPNALMDKLKTLRRKRLRSMVRAASPST